MMVIESGMRGKERKYIKISVIDGDKLRFLNDNFLLHILLFNGTFEVGESENE